MTYYHGSSIKIDSYLQPHSSKVIDDEKAVFATPKKFIACIFIPKWNDDMIGFGSYNDEWFLQENVKDAFKIFNISGYIYTVSSKNFKNDERLGLQDNEFICYETVEILKTEYIENVFDVIKNENINLIYHKEDFNL